MHGLKIINSPNSRIFTQCDHCDHVMKTTADALYYLVECPSCFKDFVVKRYKRASFKTNEQVQKVKEKVVASTNISDEAFIRTVYNMSWPVYKIGIAFSLAFGTFSFGLNSSIDVPLTCLLAVIMLTVLHYFILCIGGMYFRNRNG